MSASQDWRRMAYTLVDHRGRVFTTTNVPATIRLPQSADPNPELNKNLRELQRPQFMIPRFPEMPFLMTITPLDDPLLSRLAVHDSSLRAHEYASGWALQDDVRNSWTRLEKGLCYISDILLEALHSPESQAVRNRENWETPSDCGYRGMFRSEYRATRAARRAHVVFLFLAARCSLAVAVWQMADPPVTGAVPAWYRFLIDRNVPVSWADTLRRSAVTDFNIGMRVGAGIDLSTCPWPILIPTLRAARVPLYMYWGGDDAELILMRAWQDFANLRDLMPTRTDLACARAHASGRLVFHLYKDSISRDHPDPAGNLTTPPFGPFQYPGETRAQFFARRERSQQSLRLREKPDGLALRTAREKHVTESPLPDRRTRVYIWTRAGNIYPEAPLKWHEQDYRLAVPPSAVPNLFKVHPQTYRRYNSFFNEWDLWFPASVNQADLLTTEPGREADTPTSNDDAFEHAASPESQQIRSKVTPTEAELALQEDVHTLYPASCAGRGVEVLFVEGFVDMWYGVRPSSEDFSTVPCDAYIKDVHRILGIMEKDVPSDPGMRRSMAAWIWAMLQEDPDARILTATGDLSVNSPHSLCAEAMRIRRRISVHAYDAEDGDGTAWKFVVQYAKDPIDQAWILCTNACAVLFLVRHPDLETSQDAAQHLVLCGVPFNTVIKNGAVSTWSSADRPSRYIPGSIPSAYTAGADDYRTYTARVGELLHRPRVRAAFLKGGIVWRLVLEAVGADEDLRERFFDGVCDGPSATGLDCVASTEDERWFDDCLSMWELDTICGVYTVYTGSGTQTANLSWWPPHTVWKASGMWSGIWTPWNEEWFGTRLAAIQSGKAGPKNYSAWKDSLKSHKQARKLNRQVSERSVQFVRDFFVQQS